MAGGVGGLTCASVVTSFPAFAWATGEETADPKILHQGAELRIDQLERSGHLERLDDDLADVASLGIRVWRYGMPWRCAEPRPGQYDWTLWDRALAAADRHGLQPVVDLCHFGLPDHYDGFCDPRWVDGFTRYVEAFLARYPGPQWFCPVNEPWYTAHASAFRGYWNDRRQSLDDYALALAHCVLANLEALHRIRADRDGWLIGADAISCPADDRANPEQAAEDEAYTQAGWDLQFGLPVRPFMQGPLGRVADDVRARIDALATTEHTIAGHDLYPISVVAYEGSREQLTMAEHLDAYRRWALAWYERYGVDFWVAETSNLSLPVRDQVPWLHGLVEVLDGLRADGLAVRGLCWFSRSDSFDWDTYLREPLGRVSEVGLFDHARRPRPVAAALSDLARRDEVTVAPG